MDKQKMSVVEGLDWLYNFIDEINNQNNRGTAFPYFYVVRQKKWRVAKEGYGQGETRQVYVDWSGDPTTFHSKADFEKWYREYHGGCLALEADIQKAWSKLEEFTEEVYFEEENIFFTEEGYNKHLEVNGHNLRRHETHSYLKHAFRNDELTQLFKAISAVTKRPLKGLS